MQLFKTMTCCAILASSLIAASLEKTVYMEFKIPEIIDYESDTPTSTTAKKVGIDLHEHTNLISGSISSNAPWECSITMNQELSEDFKIKYQGNAQSFWKTLKPYQSVIVAKGNRATQDESIKVSFLTQNTSPKPIEILFTVKAQEGKRLKKVENRSQP